MVVIANRTTGILTPVALAITNALLADETLVDIALDGEYIAGVAEGGSLDARNVDQTIDAKGRLVLPGFVDCHTHACWFDPDGRHRLDEWEMKRAGRSYLEILAAGGGIMASVRAVRAATQEQLFEQLLERLGVLLRNGSTTIEVKSGYGLVAEHELKMLRAIRAAAQVFPGTVIPTALLGHALDPDVPREQFVNDTIERTLPMVHEEFPGVAIDAFCEEGAWTIDECTRLFDAAARLGHPIRVHADQFNSLGMTPKAVAIGARSVDHLEASSPADLDALARSSTFAVALPACGFHLDGRYANLRPLAAVAQERVCIGTNLNPGSAPCWSMSQVIALAVRHCGLSPTQALAAATSNPARLLGFSDRGRIVPGARADLVLTRYRDARALAFNFGDPGIQQVIVGGRLVR